MKKHTLHSLGILVAALGAAGYSCSPPPAGDGLGLGATTSTGGSSANGSGGSSNSTATGGSVANGGSANNGSSSGGSSQGGSISVPISGTTGNGATSGSSNMVDPDAACASSTASATLKTVNMFVMYDRSWSMTECANTSDAMFTGGDPRCPDKTMSRWALTSAALIKFVQDPTAAGLRVALRFFPDDHPAAGCDGYPAGGTMFGGNTMGGFMGGTAGRGNTGFGAGGATGTAGRGGTGTAGSPAGNGAAGMDNCDANACAQPLVDIGALTADPAPTDMQEQKLVDAINNSPPPDVATLPMNPQTPTSAALQGAANWAEAYEMAHQDEKTVIVLITDGEPQGCDTNATNIANIAATANMAGIQTYVIGLGLNSTALNQIAAAGGTMTAFTVSATSDSTSQLLQELIAIKGQELKCNLDVPKADVSGKEIDPNFINVAYQTGPMGMTTSTDLGYVTGMDKCGSDKDWYFDNPTTPTQIILCPAACDAVKADQTASIAITADCKMHVPVK